MSIGPANLRNDMYRWDTNSLSWVVWDGGLSVGALTIGTVDQGTPAVGADAWPVVVTDTSNALVRAGDAGNNALRVNVVAGASGGGAVTVADGADVAEGATTDAAVSTDATGTLSAKVRGIVKLLASVVTAGKVATDGSGVTQPVSGTFWQATQPVSAATLPLPTLASTSTKQSDGSQKSQVVDGAGNVIGATSNALDVNIKSGNPTTITATQATGTNLHTVLDSGVLTSITNALPAGTNAIGKLTANDGVDIGDTTINNAAGASAVNVQDGGNSITVDGAVSVTGSVTANAGTNLDTSLLALESGGNLAALTGKDFATQATLTLVETNTEPLATAQGTNATDVAGPMVQAVGDDSSTLLPSIVSPLRLDALGRLLVSAAADDVLWVAEDLIPFFNQTADSQFFDLSW